MIPIERVDKAMAKVAVALYEHQRFLRLYHNPDDETVHSNRTYGDPLLELCHRRMKSEDAIRKAIIAVQQAGVLRDAAMRLMDRAVIEQWGPHDVRTKIDEALGALEPA